MNYVGSTWVECIVLNIYHSLTLLFRVFKFQICIVAVTGDDCVHVDRGRSWLVHARGGYFLEWYLFLWR